MTIPAEKEFLPKAREFAERYGRKHGFSRENINCLRITVDEICSNIVLYAYSGTDRGDIRIEFTQQDDTVITNIVDTGVAFDYSSVKTPDLERYVEERLRGGLGLHLVKIINDDVVYERVGNRNILTIVKTLRPQS
jgi:anti-sigma regulatory factor (Ser/Thr protein kinase)